MQYEMLVRLEGCFNIETIAATGLGLGPPVLFLISRYRPSLSHSSRDRAHEVHGSAAVSASSGTQKHSPTGVDPELPLPPLSDRQCLRC